MVRQTANVDGTFWGFVPEGWNGARPPADTASAWSTTLQLLASTVLATCKGSLGDLLALLRKAPEDDAGDANFVLPSCSHPDACMEHLFRTEGHARDLFRTVSAVVYSCATCGESRGPTSRSQAVAMPIPDVAGVHQSAASFFAEREEVCPVCRGKRQVQVAIEAAPPLLCVSAGRFSPTGAKLKHQTDTGVAVSVLQRADLVSVREVASDAPAPAADVDAEEMRYYRLVGVVGARTGTRLGSSTTGIGYEAQIARHVEGGQRAATRWLGFNGTAVSVCSTTPYNRLSTKCVLAVYALKTSVPEGYDTSVNRDAAPPTAPSAL